MSGLPPKADIRGHGWNVRFVPIADISPDPALEDGACPYGTEAQKVASHFVMRTSAWRLFNIRSRCDRPRAIKPEFSI